MSYRLLVLLFLTFSSTAFADWPQWRGPHRNGIATSTGLPAELNENTAPKLLWETTEEIPSDHYGGHGSVAIADGKLFLAVVWHLDEPTETRKIDGDVLSTLGYRGTNSIPKETVEKMEHERMNLSRRLRGNALDEWAKKWVEDNLDEKTQLSLGGWVISRFKKGPSAIPLSVYDTLRTVSNKTFANQTEVEAWIDEQNFDPAIREQIVKAIPATKKVANDVILCLDAETGEVVWRFEQKGFPSGRASSSTPCVADGKVYAALSEHIYCVDTKSGEEVWKSKLAGKKGPASSPLFLDGKIIIQQNMLTAFDAATGEELWPNKEIKGANQSPAAWKNLVICNSAKDLCGVDSETGEIVWQQPGGGDGTPVVSDDTVVVSSRLDGKNLIAYQLTEGGAEELWAHGFLARRYGSSPIIHDGFVYHLGSERHICINLESGEIAWEREASSSISSPLVADGKLLVYENRGGFISMIEASGEDYNNLGKAKVGALYCASPAMAGKSIYLRTPKSVACFRFE
ncbi:MAG: hypothetical protein CMO55_02600 [Verrucomicrobiales bacterium]|nr:hypothetical protein [Verrucomicrobiales bacterium]